MAELHWGMLLTKQWEDICFELRAQPNCEDWDTDYGSTGHPKTLINCGPLFFLTAKLAITNNFKPDFADYGRVVANFVNEELKIYQKPGYGENHAAENRAHARHTIQVDRQMPTLYHYQLFKECVTNKRLAEITPRGRLALDRLELAHRSELELCRSELYKQFLAKNAALVEKQRLEQQDLQKQKLPKFPKDIFRRQYLRLLSRDISPDISWVVAAYFTVEAELRSLQRASPWGRVMLFLEEQLVPDESTSHPQVPLSEEAMDAIRQQQMRGGL